MIDQKKADDLFWWMCGGALPSGDGPTIIAEICERLVDLGVPIDRFALFIFTIHPTIKGRRLTWAAEEGVKIVEAGLDLLDTDEFNNNPLPVVARSQKSMRLNLSSPDCPDNYLIVDQLRKDGFTDYLLQPLIYIDGETHTVSWSTKNPDGFDDEMIELLERINLPLARITESYVLRLNAAYIISTYVGRNAGELVLSGKIKQGDGEDISAVIMFADLKDFSKLSNQQPNGDTLNMLNRFFGALESPIHENGGEILKFMGDGLLAIFPYKVSESGPKDAAMAAYRAIAGAHTGLIDCEGPGNTFRAALHLGELHYGNIGGARRLDFTAIGPAVNLTARLLSAAHSVGFTYVCSEDFASILPDQVSSSQMFNAKGFDDPQPIYAMMIA